MNDHEWMTYMQTGRLPEHMQDRRIPRRERWGLALAAAAWIGLIALLRALGAEW